MKPSSTFAPRLAVIHLVAHLPSVEGAQRFFRGFIFAFNRASRKPPRSIGVKNGHYCLVTTEFIDRVCSLRGMNSERSTVKVGIDYGKSTLKVSLTITDDYYSGFESRQFSPSVSAFKLSGAKRTMLLAVCQVPETHFNLQEIVPLTKINEVVDCTFAGDLEMLNFITVVGSHANTHQCAYCIPASKSWDSDTPLRTVNLNALQCDKWQKTSEKKTAWRNFFSFSKHPILDPTKPILLPCPRKHQRHTY